MLSRSRKLVAGGASTTLRSLSSIGNDISSCGGGSTVQRILLNNPPVNVLSIEVVEGLRASLREVRHDPQVAIVLAGGKSVFSAGLDITQMRQPTREGFFAYFGAVQALFFELYLQPNPVVAAIVGACPAGGCWLACLTDYRVMADSDKGQIGLNETKMGLLAPSYVAEPVIAALHSRRSGELLVQRGALLSPPEALKVGLVDEVVPAADVLPRAEAIARELLEVPFQARATTKQQLRAALCDAVRAGLPAEMERMYASISSAPVQERLSAYMASLASRKAAP